MKQIRRLQKMSCKKFFKEIYGIDYNDTFKSSRKLAEFLSCNIACNRCWIKSQCDYSDGSGTFSDCEYTIKSWLDSDVPDKKSKREKTIETLSNIANNSSSDDDVAAINLAIESLSSKHKRGAHR